MKGASNAAFPLRSRWIGGLALLLLLARTGFVPQAAETQPSEGQDARRFLEAATAQAHEPARRACEAIHEAQLRGQCYTDLARQYGVTAADLVLEDCGRLERGTWRQECHFQVAESLARRGDLSRGMSICTRSDSFRESCRHHVMGVVAVQVLEEELGTPGLPTGPPDPGVGPKVPEVPLERVQAALPRIMEVYQGHMGRLGAEREPKEQITMWSQLFGSLFPRVRPIDAGLCRSLAPVPREACERAVDWGVRSEAGRALGTRSKRTRSKLCRTKKSAFVVPPEGIAELLRLDVVSSPTVLDALARFREEECRLAAPSGKRSSCGCGSVPR